MITAAYTILKNEKKFIEKWLFYTKKFTYRVLLDTGSTDGSYEMLLEAQKDDPNLILEQKIFTPWNFSTARNYNLAMIPNEVDWCLSPDMDEYFSQNVLDGMKELIKERPDVTNISTTRLDIYSPVVFVGPPHQLPSNKIHRRNDYIWNSPIYEHLIFKHKDRNEVELHHPDIYLVHDQDFMKPERSPLYLKMLLDEYEANPKNCWTLWFLVNHYYREQDLENFIKTGCDYVSHSDQFDKKYHSILHELTNIYNKHAECPIDLKNKIESVIRGRSI